MAKWNLFKREANYDLTRPSRWFDFFGGSDTNAGEKVTKKSALKLSAVWSAVSLRSSLIASFPKYTYIKQGDTKRSTTDDVYRIIAHQPNPYMNSFTFWELLNTWLDLWGNSYAIISRKRSGELSALSPVHPSIVDPVVVDNKLIYRIKGTINREYDPRDILHFKDMSLDGITGLSKIEQAKEAIGLGLAAEKFGSEFFSKGGHSKGVLETDQALGDEAYKRFSEGWKKNANHGTPLLEYGIKYKQITIPPDQAQFISTREFQLQDVARIFNVPPHLLADLSRATFSNIEHQDLQFVKYALRPTSERYEHELEWKLYNKSLGEKFVRFDLDDILRGDMTSRSNFYSSAIANRWMSPNEVRSKENMNPYEGGDTYENPNTTSNGQESN